jgi:transcriptional regulator with XRE-family HTH domain
MPKKKDPNRATPDWLLHALGRKIRELRERNGLVLIPFATDAHMDFTNLSRIEKGKQRPSLDTLYWIAKALGMKLHELIALAESPDTAEQPLSPAAKEFARAWEALPDSARNYVEDRLIEAISMVHSVPTFYEGGGPRRASFEQKLAGLSKTLRGGRESARIIPHPRRKRA